MSTFTTDYTTSGDYTYDATKIEVSGGVAKLAALGPGTLSGVFSYYTASDGVTYDGSNLVSLWEDQSGNGKDVAQSVTASKPLYVASAQNGQPGIWFDGTDDYITGNFGTFLQQDRTVFIACIPEDRATHHNCSMFGDQQGWQYTANDGACKYAEYFGGFSKSVVNVMKDNTPTIARLRRRNGTCNFFIDGVNKDDDTVTASWQTEAADTTIGARTVGVSPFKGTILEIIVLDHDATAGDIAVVEGYLSDKYNIASISPGYSSDAPSIYKTAGDTDTIASFEGFTETLGAGNAGTLEYQCSDDGVTWQHWNSSTWVNAGAADYNTVTEVNENIEDLSATANKIYIRAFLIGDGTQKVELSQNTVAYSSDATPPVFPSDPVAVNIASEYSALIKVIPPVDADFKYLELRASVNAGPYVYYINNAGVAEWGALGTSLKFGEGDAINYNVLYPGLDLGNTVVFQSRAMDDLLNWSSWVTSNTLTIANTIDPVAPVEQIADYAFKDVEVIMEDISLSVKQNLQTVIAALNTEKGDSMITTFFDTASYFIGGLDDFPAYDTFYLQYIPADPKIIANQFEMALNVPVRLAVFYPFQDATINYERKMRYNRILYALVSKYVKKKYPSVVIEGFGSTFLSAEDDDREMIVSELAFNFDIAY